MSVSAEAAPAPAPARTQPGFWSFSLRSVLALIAVVSLGLTWLHHRHQARQSELRERLRSGFQIVGSSLRNYDQRIGHLPPPLVREGGGRRWENLGALRPEGLPLFSWRFLISPLAANRPLGSPPFDFTSSWDSASNAYMREFPNPYGLDEPNTTLFAITGPGTAFGDGERIEPLSFADLAPDTLLAVEVADSGCHWVQPGDFDIRDMPRTIGGRGRTISGRSDGGFYTLFADGSVLFLENDTPFDVLEQFFTIEGAKKADRDEELEPFIRAEDSLMAATP